MISIEVDNNLLSVLNYLAVLGDKLSPEVSKTLNRTLFGVRTDAKRRIVKKTKLNQKELDDLSFWSFKPSRDNEMEALAIIRGAPIPLEKLSPTPNTVMGGKTSGGVTVNLLGAQGTFRHAFVGAVLGMERKPKVWIRKKNKKPREDYEEMPSGRKTWLKGRFPVANLKTRSIPQVADDEDIVDAVMVGVHGRFIKQFRHQVNRLLEEFA